MWDGHVEITFALEADGESSTDKVAMRVAPVLTSHHLLPAEITRASEFDDAGNAAMRAGVDQALAAAGLPPLTTIPTGDQWNQDYFETGFMTMPSSDGRQHAIRVNIRSANVTSPDDARNPLRKAGRVVFFLRGKDSAAIQNTTRRGTASSTT